MRFHATAPVEDLDILAAVEFNLVNRRDASFMSGQATDLSFQYAAAIALHARFLKRIGAHSRNIIRPQ